MGDYERTFETRGADYNRAGAACPDARAVERQLLISRLQLAGSELVCDAPAGGGYVADGLVRDSGFRGRVLCIEPSAAFAAGIDPGHARVLGGLDRLPIADSSVDRVASLAGMHHLDDPLGFFREARRVLRPGGRLAVADVLENTPPALFLEDAVDRLTETGHQGRFFRLGGLRELLGTAGFAAVEEEHCVFGWHFADLGEMTRYCRTLFAMFETDEAGVLRELEAAFEIRQGEAGVVLEWSLLYASGTLPG